MRRIILIAPFLLCIVPGCDDGYETTGFFRVVGSDGHNPTWVVPDTENVGAGPAQLGTAASDVASAGYAIGTERSAYLFDGNLAAGIEDGGYLALPAYQPGPDIVVEGGVQWKVVEPDRPDYESFRVYDSGACSLTLDWETALLPGLVPAFGSTVVASVDAELAQCDSPTTQRFSRVSSASIEPMYRARAGGSGGGLGVDDDVIRYSARYQAPSVGGCAPVNLDLEFEIGFRQGPEREVVGFVDPETIYTEVADFCIVEGQIEDAVRDAIAAAVPNALATAVRDGTLVDPAALGLPPGPSCSNDAACSGAYPGGGHRCMSGQCQLQLDVDRVNVRPEGVELVLMEFETDPQRPLLTGLVEAFACGPDRNNFMFVLDPTPGDLHSFTVEVGENADSICS